MHPKKHKAYSLYHAMWSRTTARRRASASAQESRMPSQSPFAPLLATAIRAIAPQVDDATFKTLIVLATYTNPYLICFPGLRQLEAVTGHHHTQVADELNCLEQLGLMRYVRRGERDRFTGFYTPNQYMVSPELLYLRREVREQVLGFWEPENPQQTILPKEESPIRELRGNREHNHHITNTSNQNHESRTINQHHQPASNALRAALNEVGSMPAAQRASVPQGDEKHTPNANPDAVGLQTSFPSHQRRLPRSGEGVPPGDRKDATCDRYKVPLPSVDSENLAHDLHTEAAPARLWQCRELIDHHGHEMLSMGLNHLRAAKSKGNVHNPMGLLRSWIKKGMLEVEPKPSDVETRSRYTSGQYSHLIES